MVECLLFTMAKTIKRNFVYNLLLQISAVLFPIITAPYIARVLDPDGVGIVNFVNTYASYFACSLFLAYRHMGFVKLRSGRAT